MSKFIDSLELINTNYKVPKTPRLTLEWRKDVGYRIPELLYNVVYQADIHWRMTIEGDPEQENQLMNNVVKRLRHHVYADLATMLFDLRDAVYAQDDKSLKIIEQIFKEVGL